MIDWSIDQLMDCSVHLLINGLICWLIYWLIDWSADQLINRSVDRMSGWRYCQCWYCVCWVLVANSCPVVENWCCAYRISHAVSTITFNCCLLKSRRLFASGREPLILFVVTTLVQHRGHISHLHSVSNCIILLHWKTCIFPPSELSNIKFKLNFNCCISRLCIGSGTDCRFGGVWMPTMGEWMNGQGNSGHILPEFL